MDPHHDLHLPSIQSTATSASPSISETDKSLLHCPSSVRLTELLNKKKTGSISPRDFLIQNKDASFLDVYGLGKCLGRGTFGEVHLCVHKESGSERAVKCIRKSRFDVAEKAFLVNEITILRSLDHPNIVKMYEYFEDSNVLYLVQDVCKGGELFDEIIRRANFREEDAALIISRILNAMNYCHQRNIVHRDLKPENILLEDSKAFDAIKIVDFGQARSFDPKRKLHRRLGTPYYIAPEVIRGDYTSKCDVWSIGVLTYVLLSGSAPFDGNSPREICTRVLSGTYHMEETLSAPAKEFINALLCYDEKQRPTAEQALGMRFIVDRATPQIRVKVKRTFSSSILNNLRRFTAETKLKQATYAYIVAQLIDKEETDKFAEIFRGADVNNDGLLSKEELKQCIDENFGQLMGSFVDVDAMFNSIDLDLSGTVSYSEFITAAMESSQLLSKRRLQSAFNKFDKDGDGSISKDEVQAVLAVCEDLDVDLVMRKFDLDGDGAISFDEFVSMMDVKHGLKRSRE